MEPNPYESPKETAATLGWRALLIWMVAAVFRMLLALGVLAIAVGTVGFMLVVVDGLTGTQ